MQHIDDQLFSQKRGGYIPRNIGDFPDDDPHKHLVEVKPPRSGQRQFLFDETYPYIDHSLPYRLQRWVVAPLLLWLFIYPYNRIKFGLRIKGRRNVRGLRRDAVAICNHVYQFDAMVVKQALSPFAPVWIPMYARHFNGRQYWAVRYSGGLPVPDTRAGMRHFSQALDHYHNRGDLIIVFPEEVRWDMYTPIRPFRKGAFSMAWKYGTPLIPCVITYRRRKGLGRLLGGGAPGLTLHIGTPLIPDTSQPRTSEVNRLRCAAHESMVALAGIANNPWPAVPSDERQPSKPTTITENKE